MAKERKFTTLLFDMDNTLFDFDAAEREGVCAVMRRYGVEPTGERIARYHRVNQLCWQAFERGDINRDQIFENRYPRFFEEMGILVNAADVEKLYRATLNQGTELLPGARKLCEELSGLYDLYIVTNGLAVTQKSRLSGSGMGRYFKDVFISEEVGSQKPQPEFFDAVFLRIPEKDRKKMLIIGDSLSSDVCGGRNTGVATCWLNRKGETPQEGARPDYEIQSLEQLKEIL